MKPQNIKKYASLLVPLLLVLAINIYFRSFPVYFPQLKDRAKEVLYQIASQKIAQDVYARFAQFNPIAKDRLIKLVSFLEKELEDFEEYEKLDFKTYEADRKKRRSIERWVENIANVSIDIAKILLASKKQQLPDTYVDTVNLLAVLDNFDEEKSKKMASFVKLRNLMTHEYLDLRFNQIQEFVKEAKNLYGFLVEYTDNFLKNN